MSATDTAIFQKVLTTAAAGDISDMHLKAGSQPVVRIDGELKILTEELVVTEEFLEANLAWLLTQRQKEKFEREKQITFGYTFANRIRLRVAVFYQKGLPEISLHFIKNTPKSLKDLGLPKIWQSLVEADHGLILVAGTYGSGRTTTLASLAQQINLVSAKHIISIEEPIEYILVGAKSLIDQREVGKDVNSWAEALESLPNEDADVVILGSLNSPTLMGKAIDLALGGKLVIASIEAESCIKGLERLVNGMLPDEQDNFRARLADSLLAMSVQKLVPRMGGGRIVVTEMLIGTPAVKNIIQEGKYYQLTNVLQTSRDEGMLSFDYALAELVKTGEVLHEQAMPYVTDKELFNSIIRRS